MFFRRTFALPVKVRRNQNTIAKLNIRLMKVREKLPDLKKKRASPTLRRLMLDPRVAGAPPLQGTKPLKP